MQARKADSVRISRSSACSYCVPDDPSFKLTCQRQISSVGIWRFKFSQLVHGFRLSTCTVLLLLCFVQHFVLIAQTHTSAVPIEKGTASTISSLATRAETISAPTSTGGFTSYGPVVFDDISQKSGLASWHHTAGDMKAEFIIQSLGSGVALLDYDNDGWLDIYLVNSLSYGAAEGKRPVEHAALFHNNHDGTFTNVAEKAGVTNDRWGIGVAIGDYDNDGWSDMYVTNFGKNRLYHNNHDGTFTDVAEKAGVALGSWSTGPTFGDFDGDGLLDIFVPGYVSYDIKHPPSPGSNLVASNTCQFRQITVFCGPRGLRGEHDHLFRNNGDGTFTDVSVTAKVSDPNGYYGLTAVFAHISDARLPDLLVANDSTPNYFYHNKGDGVFDDVSFESGFAVNGEGRETASMGLAIGDYKNSGRLDVFVTNFSDDYKVLYRNDGGLSFTDVSRESGIAKSTIPFLGWGDGFIDYDNDGWKDIFLANGHVYPEADIHDWGTSFAQRPLLLRNMKGIRFDVVPALKGTGLAIVVPARGAAFGDLFNDGKVDVVLNNVNAPPTLLRNVNQDSHHWLELKLLGHSKSPADAVGAVVYLTSAKMRQRADVLSGGSFASSSDQRVHFGLGEAAAVDEVEIRWPSGTRQLIKPQSVDRILTIEEGVGVVRELKMDSHLSR